MLVHLQEQRGLPEDFLSWAIGQIDERVMSMALEYAHDAEVIVQILSFKGGTFDGLMHAIEDMYQQERRFLKGSMSKRNCCSGQPDTRRHQTEAREEAGRSWLQVYARFPSRRDPVHSNVPQEALV